MMLHSIAAATIALLLAAASGASAALSPPPPAQVYPTNNTWNGCFTQLCVSLEPFILHCHQGSINHSTAQL